MITHCVEQFSQFQCDLTFYAGNSVSQYADTQCMNFNTLNFCVIFGRAEFFLRAFCVGDWFVVPITLSECLFPYNQWLKVIENSLEKQQTLYFCSSRRCKWIVYYLSIFSFFFFSIMKIHFWFVSCSIFILVAGTNRDRFLSIHDDLSKLRIVLDSMQNEEYSDWNWL